MESVKIILLGIVAAICYGILHDQFTARICVEYFTLGHPPIFFGTEDPTLLGIGWGIIATWWVGFGLGLPLAVAARIGSRPKRDARSLLIPIAKLLAVMGICALISGLLGWILAQAGVVFLTGPARVIKFLPRERHSLFLTDLWAHSASYATGFLGGIILIISTWRSRKVKMESP